MITIHVLVSHGCETQSQRLENVFFARKARRRDDQHVEKDDGVYWIGMDKNDKIALEGLLHMNGSCRICTILPASVKYLT